MARVRKEGWNTQGSSRALEQHARTHARTKQHPPHVSQVRVSPYPLMSVRSGFHHHPHVSQVRVSPSKPTPPPSPPPPRSLVHPAPSCRHLEVCPPAPVHNPTSQLTLNPPQPHQPTNPKTYPTHNPTSQPTLNPTPTHNPTSQLANPDHPHYPNTGPRV